MTGLDTLKKKAAYPIVTDRELIDKCLTSFLDMDTDKLFHKTLISKDKKPYHLLCMRLVRRHLKIDESTRLSVGDMAVELCESVKRTNDGQGGMYSPFMNEYLNALLPLTRMHIHFMITRPNEPERRSAE